MKLLKLLGIQNLLLLAFAQLVFRYGYLELHPNIFLVLNDWQNAILVIASVFIAAGGFLMINISKDESYSTIISENKVYNLYAVLTFIGVAIGFYLSNYIEKPWFSVLFIAIAGGLYLYGTSLKYTAVVNNIVAAIFIGLSIFLGLVPVGLVLYYANAYLKELLPSLGYILLFVLGPLIYFLIQVWSAKTNKEFKRLEAVLRLVLFFTAASIAVITLNIQNNA